jgi:putative addiction module component (TIGR02574 family)
VSPANKILAEALRLNPKERASIAQRLISSLESSPRNASLRSEKAWQHEIQKRWSEIRDGKVKAIPWESVETELRSSR